MPDLFHDDTQTQTRHVHVALEQGIDSVAVGLTYAIPENLSTLDIGDRVRVPLGRKNRAVWGYVIDHTDLSDFPAAKRSRIKPILERDPHGVSLTVDLIDLARWIAGYYCCPLGMVFASILPAAVTRGTGRYIATWVGQPATLPDPMPKLTPLQKRVVEAMAKKAQDDPDDPWLELQELANLAGAKTVTPIKRLIAKNVLTVRLNEQVRARTASTGFDAVQTPTAQRPTLTPDQTRVIRAIESKAQKGFGVHLLHGVTGSGKTEVYLQLIESMLARDDNHAQPAGAIVLVPEIALTPQTVSRFMARFGAGRVALLHSGLTSAQRHEQWRRIRHGDAHVVVGARSAVFAPLANLQLLIVDEEHESSYKQDQLPRYHARDVAIKRAQSLGVSVVLGSATPSLESYYNATVRHSYHLQPMPNRVPGMSLPKITVIDLQAERKARRGIHLISTRLEHELDYIAKTKRQALLFLNRRGYANYIACPDHNCGWMHGCSYCDVTMVYHKNTQLPTGGLTRCHHCNAEQLLPKLCPQCGKKITVFGLGVQRVEEELNRKFPGLNVERMDSDVMCTSQDYDTMLARFGRGEIDVLCGTQMIAKGLDFPNVGLVGVISADTALHMPDFRAAERTFGLIAQVSGRSGRSAGNDDHDGLGRVIVQTFNPDDPAITLAAAHDYEGFATREIALREQVGLPPIGRLARIVCRDEDPVAVVKRIADLAGHITHFNEALGHPVRIKGPMPCPVARVAGFHRHQIEMLAVPGEQVNETAAAMLQRLLTELRNAKVLQSDAHTAVDVDPVALL